MSNKFQDAEISEIMVNTGQHYDFNMDGAFHTKSPDYTLNIRHENPNQFLTDVQIGLERITRIKDIDGILVYGDTISTLAGALFANKHNKKLFHIEAGLRSGDSSMPEEIVRIMTDMLAYRNYCPSSNAVKNLVLEGLNGICTGDILVEIFNTNTQKIENTNKHYVLATIHRKENTDNLANLRSILKNLSALAQSKKIVMPIHPRTKRIIEEQSLYTGQIEAIDPVDLDTMYTLLCGCDFVVTDSGGLQREAYLAGKECFVVRASNEWDDLLNFGNQSLITVNSNNPFITFHKKNRPCQKGLLGDGKASQYIIEDIKKVLGSD